MNVEVTDRTPSLASTIGLAPLLIFNSINHCELKKKLLLKHVLLVSNLSFRLQTCGIPSSHCQINQSQRNGAVPPLGPALWVHQPRAHFSVPAIGRRAGARGSHHRRHRCRCVGCSHGYKAHWLEKPRGKMMD